MKLKDETGAVYGHLTVLAFAGTKGTRALWQCRCACGTEKVVSGKHLRAGQVISCGCQKGPKVQFEDKVARRKELDAMNPHLAKEARARYLERHADRARLLARERSSMVRARRRKLKPKAPWSERALIAKVYQKAKEFGLTVDHVVPIQSDLVCGLHVWSNLQLLDATINKSKGNHHWPDMPDESRLTNATLQSLTA